MQANTDEKEREREHGPLTSYIDGRFFFVFFSQMSVRLSLFCSEARHPDRHDQSDDGEGGASPRFAVCGWSPGFRRHPGAGTHRQLVARRRPTSADKTFQNSFHAALENSDGTPVLTCWGHFLQVCTYVSVNEGCNSSQGSDASQLWYLDAKLLWLAKVILCCVNN